MPPRRQGLQLRDARLRSALLVLPELGDVAGAARPARRGPADRRLPRRDRRSGARASRPRRRQHLQRAADHRGMGRRRVSRGAGARPDDGVRVEWQRHAGGPALSRSVDRSLQGRSQELRRSALSPAWRAPRADPRNDPGTPRSRDLAGDRDAADPRLQRFARRDRSPDVVPRRCLALDPVARHRVSQGLSDDRSREHDAGDARRGRGRRTRATGSATSTPATCPDASATWRTRGVTLARRCSSSGTAISCGSIA